MVAFQTPVLVQQTAAASTTLSPASFAPAFGGATAVGSMLIALVATANSSGAPTITTPTNWTLVGSANNASVGEWVYIFPNNPGAITTVTFAGLTNIFALSVSLLEFNGMPNSAVLDPATGGPANFPTNSPLVINAAATSLSSSSVTTRIGNGLWIGLLACNATGTITNTSTPSAGAGAWTNGSTATSTTGTNNVKTQSLWSAFGPVFPSSAMQVSGSWGASVFCGVLMLDFLSLASGALNQIESGNSGGAMGWTSTGAGQAVGV